MMTTLKIKLRIIRLECLDLVANKTLHRIHGFRILTINKDASLVMLHSELCDKFYLE